MGKVKTRKSLTKRFRVTKNGKVLRRQGFARHLKAGKSQRRLRRLSGTKVMTGPYAKRVRKAMGK